MGDIGFKTRNDENGNLEVKAGLMFQGLAIIDKYWPNQDEALDKTKEQLEHSVHRSLLEYLEEHAPKELDWYYQHRRAHEMQVGGRR